MVWLCVLREDTPRVRGNTPFIFNPATNCAFNLPRFPANNFGMAYATASMAYKVVASYPSSGGVTQCAILTVGVDKTWRHVHVAVEGLSAKARWFLVSCPFMTGGFLHWFSKTHVLSLNVETEILTVTPTPTPMLPPDYRYCCLSTGRYLSLFISCAVLSWEVWEMKPETLEWRKVLPNINLEAHKSKIQQFALQKDDVLEPVGWLRYPEVLAFLVNGRGCSCIIYNLDTQEIDSFKFSTEEVYHRVVQHRNTLVWSEWC